jgi:NitT/TauT family transport system substrate-binding protein
VTRTPLTLVAALACCAAATGCGGSSDGGGAAKGAPATIHAASAPLADVAPLYLGIRKGFFKEEKLTVKTSTAENGSAVAASVIRGANQFGFASTVTLLIAASKNVPLQIVAPGAEGGSNPGNAWDAVLVKKSSPIKSARDLLGKTVAVGNLQSLGPLSIKTALEKRGLDYKKLKILEVPFPEANAALDTGRVDAALVIEPYYTEGLAHGSRPVLHPYLDTAPNLPTAAFFTDRRYSEKHADVTARFVRAITKSRAYAQSHPAEVRSIVLTYTKIPRPVAEKMRLSQWRPELNEPLVDKQAKLAEKYGLVKKAPSLDDLIRHP